MHINKYELAIMKTYKKRIKIYLYRQRVRIVIQSSLKLKLRLATESYGPWNEACNDCF